jgi:hypothetical protein
MNIQNNKAKMMLLRMIYTNRNMRMKKKKMMAGLQSKVRSQN